MLYPVGHDIVAGPRCGCCSHARVTLVRPCLHFALPTHLALTQHMAKYSVQWAAPPVAGCPPGAGLACNAHVYPLAIPLGQPDLMNCRVAQAAFDPNSSAEEINTINSKNLGCDVKTEDRPLAHVTATCC